jgi:hypothetical protein
MKVMYNYKLTKSFHDAFVESIFKSHGNYLYSKHLLLTLYNGPTNALAFNKTLIQMSQTTTLKITPTCFDHQMIIRELFDPA